MAGAGGRLKARRRPQRARLGLKPFALTSASACPDGSGTTPGQPCEFRPAGCARARARHRALAVRGVFPILPGARPRTGRREGRHRLDLEENMKKKLTASALAILALAVSVPAFAGGGHCS